MRAGEWEGPLRVRTREQKESTRHVIEVGACARTVTSGRLLIPGTLSTDLCTFGAWTFGVWTFGFGLGSPDCRGREDPRTVFLQLEEELT